MSTKIHLSAINKVLRCLRRASVATEEKHQRFRHTTFRSVRQLLLSEESFRQRIDGWRRCEAGGLKLMVSLTEANAIAIAIVTGNVVAIFPCCMFVVGGMVLPGKSRGETVEGRVRPRVMLSAARRPESVRRVVRSRTRRFIEFKGLPGSQRR
eukprot:764329-Hanusia_phi.AAC.1